MDSRRLQRALFRMQHDADFAARLRAGDAAAAASTGLGSDALMLLRALDPDAVAADKDGKRAAQFLRNVTSEFSLCLRVTDADGPAGWPAAFPRSPHFHCAVSGDTPLPLAFGAFAAEYALASGDLQLGAIAQLERALAIQRRRPERPAAGLALGIVALAPGAEIVPLPEGSFALASALQAAREGAAAPAGGPPALPAPLGPGVEHVLIIAGAAPAPYGLRAVRAEALVPLVALFLRSARDGLDPAAVRDFARAHGLVPGEITAVVSEYEAEGVLQRGPAAPERSA